MPDNTRRQFLQVFGITVATGLAGCSQQLEPSNGNSENGETGEPTTEENSGTGDGSNPVESDSSETSPESEKNTTETSSYPETGTFQVNTADGSLGPDGIFEGDVELNIPLTEQELVQQVHFNQLSEYAGYLEPENKQTLREFPENITDHDWRMENIYFPRADMFEGVSREEIEDQFKPEEYTGEDLFIDRFKGSNYPQLWNLLAHVTLGGPDSGNDYIKAAGIAETEYHAANKNDNMTTSTKTNDGIHGTVWFLENTSWTPNNEQNVYIVETAPTREQQIIDFDKTGSYPHNQVFTDAKNERDTTKMAWKGIGKMDPKLDYDNIPEVKLEGRDHMREAFLNSSEYAFKPIAMSSILTEHINNHATPEGYLPQIEQLTINLGEETTIEYELA